MNVPVEPKMLTDMDIVDWIVDARNGCSVPPDVFLGILAAMNMEGLRQVLQYAADRARESDRIYSESEAD